MLTIFTPTYNRQKTIASLFDSLLKQTCYRFEWLVIDDGSDDKTSLFFDELQTKVLPFNIRYIKMPKNGGKHRAINLGVQLAKGDYFFIVDSDDVLTGNSIELVISWITTLDRNDTKIIGVSGLKGDKISKKMIGKTFEGSFVDSSALERENFNIAGDKSEVYKTEIMRKYRFPEIHNEKFMTESIVWNRMANDGYKIRYFNKVNYLCEYRNDGLTRNIDKIYNLNFKGYSLYIKELLKYNVSSKIKFRALIAYCYRGSLKKRKYRELAKSVDVSLPVMISCAFVALIYKILSRK